jgi:macrolide-specific efflux system membrane fusion protein
VVRIAPEARVEQNVTLFDVVIEVENTDGKLKSGMNASVEIVLLDEPDVLTIPLAALQRGDGVAGKPPGPSTVLVKTGDGYSRREIRTGRSDYRVIEVLDGLEHGEVLGIPMTSRLKDQHEELQQRIRESRTFSGPEEKKKGDRQKAANGAGH